jgi:acyl transferase domain-containing protein
VEPIAIIGASCRFPGASGLAEFWQLLREGRNAVSEVPKDRWSPEAVDANPDSPVRTATRYGAFLKNIREFDCAFFGISPREAAAMDPQQRLLLEMAYESFEDAGVPMEALAGSQTAVYVGIGPGDYGRMCAQPWESVTAHYVTGNFLSTAVDRIAYFFDLRGPAMAVDTACSSSLVSLHLACRSLESGEADLALAGGVNAVLAPTLSISLAKAGALSPTGQCRSFDAHADGYVRGEGCGFVVLKRLNQAVKDGDRIYAVVRGTAVRQGGRRNGLTAPGGWGEEAVMKAAWQAAAMSPTETDYVEVQGTGTVLGDAIEANAVGKVFAPRNAHGPCRIGSVKTNIGHLETAAGVAGLIKVALMISHGEFVPSLFPQQPNPHVNGDKLGIAVQTRSEPWQVNATSHRTAGISSFGMGGTYAHVCLTSHDADVRGLQDKPHNPEGFVLPLSARHTDALRQLVQETVAVVETTDENCLRDLCRAAAVRRTHHEYRVAFAGSAAEDLAAEMYAWLQVVKQPARATGKRKLTVLISGAPGSGDNESSSAVLQIIQQWGVRPARSLTLVSGKVFSADTDSSEIALDELAKLGMDFLDLTAEQFLSNAELPSSNGVIVPGVSAHETASLKPLRIAAQLYSLGYPIAWAKICPGTVRQVSLPGYPWQHQVCWLESLDARQPIPSTIASHTAPTPKPSNGSLQALLSRITGRPAQEIRSDASLRELGIDSLLTLELQEELRRLSGKLIPIETLVQVQSVSELESLIQGDASSALSRASANETTVATAAFRSTEVREAVFTDYEKIAALLVRNGLVVKGREEWEHLWRSNPVYQQHSGWPIGWVVEHGQDIVGFLGNIPLKYHFKGRQILASGLHAFALDSSHRGLGLVLLNRLLEFAPDVEYFVGSTANSNSSKVLDRLGVGRMPVGDWEHSSFWITNYDGFVRSALSKKRWPNPLSHVASPALKVYDKILKNPWPHQRLVFIQQTTLGESFDHFWQELLAARPDSFLADRSSETLNWHFKCSLAQGKAWIVTHEVNSRILAYAVFQRQDYEEIGLKRMRLVDYQALPGTGDSLTSLLAWGLHECQAQGIHMLEAFGFHPQKQQIIDRLAPHRRKLSSWTYFHKIASSTLQEQLRDASAFDPCQYDGDASL